MFNNINVISVDDNSVNLLLIEAIVKDLGMKVISFTSAKTALDYINDGKADIVLTDYMMPEMSGVELIKKIRKEFFDLPVIMITAVNGDNQIKIDALEAGATAFLNKPLDPSEIRVMLVNLANLRNAQLLLKNKASFLEDKISNAIKSISDREHETLSVLGRVSEYRDKNTASHVNRVAIYSTIILNGVGVKDEELEMMFFASPLHDIGKIGIPDNILLKPFHYAGEEFEIMKKHTLIGFDMLKDAKSPYLQKGAQIALSHHEKYDGSGYPYNISGDDIPLVGRIVSIADVFDALTTKRPYKEPWSFETAIEFIKNEKSKSFDPDLVDIFVDKLSYIKDIYMYICQTGETVSFSQLMEQIQKLRR